MSARVVAGVLLVAAAAVYAWQLDRVPTYISPDEAIISVDAHTLATTGRDVTGTFLPLYFRVQMPGEKRSGWFTPAIFYLSAAFQQVLPFTEWSVRMPSVLVGMLNLVLIYFVGKALFDSAWLGLSAAALLALSPAHFIFSRYALDYLYPAPFLLAWLLCLVWAVRSKSTPMAAAAGLCLGLGFYSYAAAVLLVPVLLILTVLVLREGTGRWSDGARAAAGFALPLVGFAIWFAMHPTAYSDTVQRYELYDARNLSALQGLRELVSFPNIERMTSLYWSFFNPSFLFLSGDQHMMYSTRAAGAFAMVMVVLIPLGLYQIFGRDHSAIATLIVAVFVLTPLPAVLVPEAGAMNRTTALLPFGALIATYGVKLLWSTAVIRFARPVAWAGGLAMLGVGLLYGARTLAVDARFSGSAVALVVVGGMLVAFASTTATRRQGPLLAAGLLAIAVLQFGSFAHDYFGDYRLRVNSWLGGNLRGALETLIGTEAVAAGRPIYFAHLQATGGLSDIRNRWMDAYWRFYLIKHGREDLLARSTTLESGALASVPPGGIVLGNLGDRAVDAMLASGELTLVAAIPELDREPYFALLARPER